MSLSKKSNRLCKAQILTAKLKILTVPSQWLEKGGNITVSIYLIINRVKIKAKIANDSTIPNAADALPKIAGCLAVA